ncbi:hypothetical protein BGX28_003022 [Mortierella sp. GBA30]|nr:hypothetical protein BGX28_003022 [Mortierella sp. GBA30]
MEHQHQQEESPFVDHTPSTPSRSVSRRSTIGGKHYALNSRTPPAHATNPFMDDDNPFLVHSSTPAKTKPHSRQKPASRKVQDDDDNPFVIGREPVSKVSRSSVAQVVKYNDSPAQNPDHRDSQGDLILTSTPPSRTHVDTSPSSSLLAPNSSRRTDQHRSTLDHTSHQSRSSRSRHSGDSFDYRNAGTDDLKRARKELKAWEVSFKDTHQRTATLDDIYQDEVMVKRYKHYGKLKKALAAKASQEQRQPSQASEVVEGYEVHGQHHYESSRQRDLLRTPTKPSRAVHLAGLARTPTRKQEVEFVSPRKVVNSSGFMSPSRKTRNGDDRHQFLSSISASSPKSQRTKMLLMSPSRRRLRMSPHGVSRSRSPSSLFTVREQINEDSDTVAREEFSVTDSIRVDAVQSNNPFLLETTSYKVQRTPTTNRTSSLHIPNPFQSPSHSRTSPFFGGMNHRRPKRTTRTIEVPVMADLEPEDEHQTQHEESILLSPRPHIKSPLLSTPQKTSVAKAARSLLRRPSVSLSVLSSPHRSKINFHDEDANDSMQGDLEHHLTQHGRSRSPMDEKHNTSSLSYQEIGLQPGTFIQDTAQALEQGFSETRVVQGFDTDEHWENECSQSPVHGLLSPSRPRRTSSQRPPTTPTHQRSLTLSQHSPVCVTPEGDFLVVPAGFHSHNRRRQARSTLFIPSQEEAEQFEREFNLKPKFQKHPEEGSYQGDHDYKAQELEDDIRATTDDGGHEATSDREPWEEQEEDKSPFSPGRRAAPKKKYTQKRTTRLHRIAVAPSEKSESKRPAKPSARSRKAAELVEPRSAMNQDSNEQEPGILIEQESPPSKKADTSSVKNNTPSAPNIVPAKTKHGPIDDGLGIGWANSNKPLIKSDRRIPGVGQGRAGARKPTASKFGGPSSDGNFVAYNLQRGFKKGGARGRSRYGGSRSTAMGGAGSGRTLFDADNWRAEYDKDFDDATLLMSLENDTLEVEDDDDDIPWYGNVNDITDPYVITISEKYLRRQIGEANDPEEYIKALELHNSPDGNDDSKQSSNGFRVNLEYILKKVWGYPSFRDGQLDSIKRILSYESSLLVLPTGWLTYLWRGTNVKWILIIVHLTNVYIHVNNELRVGSGKSLSYQLPAYIFSKLGIPSLTLVISPMISLMYDQVKHLPPGLPGACWTSVEQSTAQFKDFMEKLTTNAIKILFISPEKLQSQSFLTLVRSRRIPPIPFLCVDEVHCLSEWSHNFRPAYLLMNHILKTDLKSPCVLGLTGTATEGTKDSICSMLDIDRTMGVLSGPVIRENLAMTVSLETDREPALINLLQSPKFVAMGSILIYVMKQAQADALAAFLRVRNFSAESYHAGKSPQDRQRIQQRFMSDSVQKAGTAGKIVSSSSAVGSSGGIRVLVATIAFGLGLNKSNIRSVIHYCMPKSLENYIQEIGRSGRDGEKAYCHMFLNQDDYLRLRSLAYADGMDWACLLRLIKKLFSRRELQGTVSASTKSVKGRNKRRGVDETTEEDQDVGAQEEFSQGTGSKKRKQNDNRALNVKAKVDKVGSGSRQQSLVMSTSSILVIPPPSLDNGLTLVGNQIQSRCRRLVVVREEVAEEEFDIKKEILATLLSYIELDESRSIKVIGSISAKCTVKFLQESEALAELAEKTPLIDIIMKQGMMTGYNSGSGGSSSYGKARKGNKSGLARTTLSMAYCCDSMSLCQQSGMSFTELVQELQLWKRRKWIVFEMTDPALCVEILREPVDCTVEYRRRQQEDTSRNDSDVDMTPRRKRRGADEHQIKTELLQDDEMYENDHDAFILALTDRLYRKLCAVERVGVAKVDQVYGLFQSVATATWQQQEVFKPRIQGFDDDDEDEDGADSSEYDEEIDAEYIEMRARAKARAKNRSSSSDSISVTESEIVLRHGIQEYFAKRSGEGIGGLHAEEDLFQESDSDQQRQQQQQEDVGQKKVYNMSLVDKSIRLYSYENPIVLNLQRKWRSAAEVDLKVFLNQQWQQQLSSESTTTTRPLDSPRIVSRIFHGIQSPCFSALEWSRTKYWGKYFHFDFAQLMQMADRITKEQRRQRLQQQQSHQS